MDSLHFKRQMRRSANLAIVTLSSAVSLAALLAFLVPFAAAMTPLFSWQVTAASKTTVSAVEIFRTAAHTFSIAICSVLVALAIGVPTAFFLAERRFFASKIIMSFAAVPVAVPPLIIALGYVSVFGMNGIANRFLMATFSMKEPPLTFLYSPIGVIISQGFYNFPLVAVIVADVWQKLPQANRDAARILGAGEGRVFFTVTLHELFPSIAAAAIPIFLYCFSSFLIVLMFGGVGLTTLEVEIYQAARATLDLPKASALALVETSCALATVFVYSRLGLKSAKNTGLSWQAENISQKPKIAGGFFQTQAAKIFEKAAFCLLLTLISIFFVLPFLALALFAGKSASTTIPSISNLWLTYKNLFSAQGFAAAVRGTFTVAPLTAFFSCVTAFTVAAAVKCSEERKKHAVLQTLPALPLAVSSVVLGYGITLVFTKNSVATLVMAETALLWPIAFRQIHGTLEKLPQDTLFAARLLSPQRTDLIFKIFLPTCQGAIFNSFGFCLAASIGDTTLPLLLSVPRFDTLALYTYRLAGSYKFEQSCACGTILFLTCILIFSAIKIAEKQKKRTEKKNDNKK